MPAVYQKTFHIRQYECDAYGHLNNVNYVRFMQETAIEASASVGWTLERYQEAGTQWIIRETHIEYLLPVFYGEAITISTWVDDFRKVRSFRRYEFRRASGELVARAITDWVYVTLATLQPTNIPTDMVLAFHPEGNAPTLTRDKFPVPPPRPVEVFTHHKRVEWRDIDRIGHANNASYFAFIEDTGMMVGKHFGWSVQRMQEAQVAIVVRTLHVQYMQSAVMDDVVQIQTYLSDLRRSLCYRHYILERESDQAILAYARALCVFIDLQTLKPIKPPPEMVSDFMRNVSQA